MQNWQPDWGCEEGYFENGVRLHMGKLFQQGDQQNTGKQNQGHAHLQRILFL
jgi:hypothetical protein